MTLKTEFFDYLKTHPTITAKVATRVFAEFAPKSAALPFLTYERTASPGFHTIDGSPASVASPIASPTFQINVWASGYEQAEDVAEAVRDALDGFQGMMGAVDVRKVILENEFDGVTDLENGSEGKIYRIAMDFKVWYRRSVPAL